jgi:hypothetical protein
MMLRLEHISLDVSGAALSERHTCWYVTLVASWLNMKNGYLALRKELLLIVNKVSGHN